MRHTRGHEFRLTSKGDFFKNSFTDNEEILVDLDLDGDLVGLFLWSEFLQDWMALDYDSISEDKRKLIQKKIDEYKEENDIGNDLDDEF